MAELAKLYRITGYYMKQKRKISLSFECRALKVEDAIEKVFSEIGSRHNVKRHRIFIDRDKDVQEISLEEARDPEYQDMEEKDFVIFR